MRPDGSESLPKLQLVQRLPVVNVALLIVLRAILPTPAEPALISTSSPPTQMVNKLVRLVMVHVHLVLSKPIIVLNVNLKEKSFMLNSATHAEQTVMNAQS